MYVCTYVPMYICVCMCVRTYVCMFVCMYECMYVCVYVCAYVRTYVCKYVTQYIIIPLMTHCWTYQPMSWYNNHDTFRFSQTMVINWMFQCAVSKKLCLYSTHTHTHTHKLTHTHAHTHSRIHAHTHSHIHAHTHTHSRARTHATNTNTHRHKCTKYIMIFSFIIILYKGFHMFIYVSLYVCMRVLYVCACMHITTWTTIIIVY